MSGAYMIVMLLTLAIGGIAQAYVSAMIGKYNKVASRWMITGADMAYRMSRDLKIPNVGVNRGGPNQDFFDPRTNAVTLGTEAFDKTSITAIATAVHEMGHAQQYAEGYSFMKFRSALVPVTNFCSNAWMFIFFGGLVINMTGLVKLGIIMFAAVLLFHVVTLPVEFNASSRGLQYLRDCGMDQVELAGASRVLRACAFTYVAAALSAALQLLYLLFISRD